MYQVANWCFRSSGSFGGRLFAVGLVSSRLLSRPRNCRTRRTGEDSAFVDRLSSMSVSRLHCYATESWHLAPSADPIMGAGPCTCSFAERGLTGNVTVIYPLV